MIKQDVVRYLNNMANMASSNASATGGSVMAVEAYDKKNYARDFAERYDFALEQLVLVPTEEKLNAILKRWLSGTGRRRLKDRWLANTFCNQLRRSVGEEKMTLIPPPDSEVLSLLSRPEGEGAPGYVVDELAFALFNEGALCFLLGHRL